MKKRNSTIALLVLIAMGVAIFSFFLPFMSLKSSGYTIYSSSGFELFKEVEDAAFLYVALGSTIVGIAAAFMNYSGKTNLFITLIASVVGIVSIWAFFAEVMDFVLGGFWMFVFAHIASVALCMFTLFTTPDDQANPAFVISDNMKVALILVVVAVVLYMLGSFLCTVPTNEHSDSHLLQSMMDELMYGMLP